MSPKLDLVFGASGYIGSNLTPFLLEEGRHVRALVAHYRSAGGARLEGRGALRSGRLETRNAGRRSFPASIRLITWSIRWRRARSSPELDAKRRANFAVAAAGAQGVRRIVYLGGLIPKEARSAHLRSRAETGDILREGSVPVTELRAGMIVGPGSAAWEVIRDLVNHLPVMVTPRWVFSRSTPSLSTTCCVTSRTYRRTKRRPARPMTWPVPTF